MSIEYPNKKAKTAASKDDGVVYNDQTEALEVVTGPVEPGTINVTRDPLAVSPSTSIDRPSDDDVSMPVTSTVATADASKPTVSPTRINLDSGALDSVAVLEQTTLATGITSEADEDPLPVVSQPRAEDEPPLSAVTSEPREDKNALIPDEPVC
jgi:hypothetical protein